MEMHELLNPAPRPLDVNGALDACVKEKLNQYKHDYNERNFFFFFFRERASERARERERESE